jgi:hypothetical protein
LAIPGKAPGTSTKTLGDLLDEDEAESMAEVKATKAKKAKAVETEEEPEVRKAAPKVESVPAKKNKLADIVADWDDE